ncbi:hypothetical protein BX600DRAFT_163186 [Xylariales sp. PMI_506]|nr:hypothetical protein BX600DRAFT_163186 [Xylariales sp. PMI_506]
MSSKTPSVSSSSSSKAKETKTRTRSGCLTCRREAKVRCDGQRPVCMRCTRLRLHCKFEDKHIPLRERRRLESERRAAAQPNPNILPTQTTVNLELPLLQAPGGQVMGFDHLLPDLDLGTAQPVGMYDLDDDPGAGLCDDPFDTISWSLTDDLSDSFHFISPSVDMMLGLESAYASLPSLVALTQVDYQALDYLQKELVGFGSKSPPWSTHAILMRFGSERPMVLHLLLAASMTELGCQRQSLKGLPGDAEKHYQLGRDLLLDMIASKEQPDHVAVMSSLWCLYLCQRRDYGRQTVSHRDISNMMRGYIQKHRLDRMLTLSVSTSDTAPQSSDTIRPEHHSLLARLTIWFFWTDVQSCFQGSGGSIARLLLQSSRPSLSRGILDIFEQSRGALELNWGSKYPDSELADDLKNGAPLELVHRTWVIVQDINEATEHGPLDPSKSREIKAEMDELRFKFPFSSVFRLAKSGSAVRDRLMGNADWAVCNYYALCIYHFRCSVDTASADMSSIEPLEDIAAVVAELVLLIQRTLAAGGKFNIDRLQWPLFWAGIETSDPVYRDWILMKLTNPELQAALEIVLLEQSSTGRIGIKRIRRICEEKCSGGVGASFQVSMSSS